MDNLGAEQLVWMPDVQRALGISFQPLPDTLTMIANGRKTETRRILTRENARKYGVGAWLYVREPWRAPAALDACDDLGIAMGRLGDGEGFGIGRPACSIEYGSPYRIRRGPDQPEEMGRIRASLTMPPWAARFLLCVQELETQRVQDIDDPSLHREGMTDPMSERRQQFAHLWDRCYGTGSWDSNPPVLVIRFRAFEVVP